MSDGKMSIFDYVVDERIPKAHRRSEIQKWFDDLIGKHLAEIAALTRTLREASDGHKRLKAENESLSQDLRMSKQVAVDHGFRAQYFERRVAEIDALKQENERLANVKRTIFCLYCGKDFYHYAGEFPPSKEEASEAYKACFDHDRACPDNPIVQSRAAAEAREREIREKVEELEQYIAKNYAKQLLGGEK